MSQSREVGIFRIYPWIVLAAMIGVTTWASLEKSVGFGFEYLLAERWGIATLFDAYFGFLTFYAWVLYKETSFISRLAWLVAILIFGNIAMAVYLLVELRRLPAGAGFDAFLTRRTSNG